MKEKINLAELLKDCPQGLKLYSPIFGNVYLSGIRPHLAVIVKTANNQKEYFSYDGRFGINGECMLFPSNENRDWSTFKGSFNNGDVVATSEGQWIGITTGGTPGGFMPTYCIIKNDGTFEAYLDIKIKWCFSRLASEKEKQKLFDAIKANGYKWNEITKTLERLIEPKFKIGDKIKYKNGKDKNGVEKGIILSITDDTYDVAITNNMGIFIPVTDQDDWELVPNKFDINTLIPFESRVLVRPSRDSKWCGSFFSHIDEDFRLHGNKFVTTAVKSYPMCIPYEGNEHLLGTTNDCNDFYKTWEK